MLGWRARSMLNGGAMLNRCGFSFPHCIVRRCLSNLHPSFGLRVVYPNWGGTRITAILTSVRRVQWQDDLAAAKLERD